MFALKTNAKLFYIENNRWDVVFYIKQCYCYFLYRKCYAMLFNFSTDKKLLFIKKNIRCNAIFIRAIWHDGIFYLNLYLRCYFPKNIIREDVKKIICHVRFIKKNVRFFVICFYKIRKAMFFVYLFSSITN